MLADRVGSFKASSRSFPAQASVAAMQLSAQNGVTARTGALATGQGLRQFFATLEQSGCGQIATLARPNTTLASARHNHGGMGQKGEWELLRLSPDLYVISSNVTYERPASFAIPGEGLIELHFRLSGRLSLADESRADRPLEIDRGSLLIWRQPSGKRITGFLDAEEREVSVTIYMRPEVLEQYFGDFASALPAGLAEKLRGDDASLFYQRMNLIPRLGQLVNELATSHLTGGMRLVQAEALVMMILCEVMTMLASAPRDVAGSFRMSDADVRCLRRAHAVLRERHAPPPTIEELSREVGLSATKLKNGFKALFGVTMSQFANDIRMRRALELLRKPDISILQVSEMLGYEHQNSFTVAFRRCFDVLPKDYRRSPASLRIPGE